MKGQEVTFKTYEVVCREGDLSTDLYYVKSGILLACTIQGTIVKALGKITEGEFLGELSFFDGKPRASHVVAMTDCEVVKVTKQELENVLPVWFQQAGTNMTKKIRQLDKIVHDSHLRRFDTQEIKPLSIDEQRALLKVISRKS